MTPTQQNRPEQALAPRTLRARQVTQLYGVSRATLFKLAADQKLQPVRVGSRCTLWPVDQLDRLFAGKGVE